jgi:hypothetical protein
METTIAMAEGKKIALVANDNKKEELFEWAELNCKLLAEHSLYATGTTGQLLTSRLGLNVMRLDSGPLGQSQDEQEEPEETVAKRLPQCSSPPCRKLYRVTSRVGIWLRLHPSPRYFGQQAPGVYDYARPNRNSR